MHAVVAVKYAIAFRESDGIDGWLEQIWLPVLRRGPDSVLFAKTLK